MSIVNEVEDKGRESRIAAVVLAAGCSSRMGEPKQLLPVHGIPMLETVIGRLLPFSFHEIIAVVGHREAEIRDRVRVADPRFRWISNPSYAEGMSRSLQAAVGELDASVDGMLVFLGDQPLLRTETIRAVMEAIRAQADDAPVTVVRPVSAGQPGHPVYLPAALFPHVLALEGDKGAKAAIAHAGRLLLVEADDPGATADIDTPDDYRNLLRPFP